MKRRWMVCILVIIAILTGCTDGNGNRSGNGVEVIEQEKVNSRLKLEDVTQALETRGLKLLQIHPKGGTSPFTQLNDVEGVTFAIDTYRMGDAADEASSPNTSDVKLYIYVFDSGQARIEGRTALNDILARVKMVAAPSVFERKNVLLLYLKPNGEKDNEYDQMIQSAIERL
jgi:hypothetical protein